MGIFGFLCTRLRQCTYSIQVVLVIESKPRGGTECTARERVYKLESSARVITDYGASPPPPFEADFQCSLPVSEKLMYCEAQQKKKLHASMSDYIGGQTTRAPVCKDSLFTRVILTVICCHLQRWHRLHLLDRRDFYAPDKNSRSFFGVYVLNLVPRSFAAVLTFAHVNVSTITHKIMYQTYEKLQEMCMYFRYFLTWEVLQIQVQVV